MSFDADMSFLTFCDFIMDIRTYILKSQKSYYLGNLMSEQNNKAIRIFSFKSCRNKSQSSYWYIMIFLLFHKDNRKSHTSHTMTKSSYLLHMMSDPKTRHFIFFNIKSLTNKSALIFIILIFILVSYDNLVVL